MNKKTAWLISPSSPVPGEGWGGVKTHTELLNALLAKLGFEVITIVPSGVSSGGAGIEPVASAAEPHTAAWQTALRGKAEELLAVSGPDVVISEGYYAAGIEDVLKKRGIPLVAFVHNFHLVHFQKLWAEIDSARALAYYLVKTIPRLLLLIFRHERPFLRKADMVLSVSEKNSALLRSFYRLPPSKVQTLHNWAADVLFVRSGTLRAGTRAKLLLAQDPPVFLALGALWKPKGFQVAIAAFKLLAAEEAAPVLLIAGSGNYEPRLKAIAGKQLLESGRIRFLGTWPREDLPALYSTADIFIMPSTHPEGLAYTLIEAMAAGLPAIATDLGGNTETVGDAGILVPHSDPERLCAAMLKLARDPGTREKLAARSAKRALELFSEKTAMEKLDSVLRRLC